MNYIEIVSFLFLIYLIHLADIYFFKIPVKFASIYFHYVL